MTIVAALVLLAGIGVAGFLGTRRALYLTRLVQAGRAVDRSGHWPRRVRNEAVIVLGQRKLFQRLLPGLMHAFIFWGFIVLLPTVIGAMLGAVDPDWHLPWFEQSGVFAFLVDLFATLVAVGCLSAFYIRKVVRPRRFEGSHKGEADLILVAILGIVTTLLLWHASRIALGENAWPEAWSPVSNLLSNLLGDGSVTEVLERVFVWAHVAIILSFGAYLPHSKHLHIATAGVNVFFGRTRARGRLEPLSFDEEGSEDELSFGAATAADLTWKEMLDTLSCTECGRCQDVCPAFNTGKELSPKLLIMDLRDALLAQGDAILEAKRTGVAAELPPLVPNAVSEQVVWDCLTCGACVRECPVGIEHVDHIVDLRRNLVMVDSSFPQEAGGMLRDVERSSNPWGRPQSERAAWAAGLPVHVLEEGEQAPEYLYWVGCAASFDERAQATAKSVARLLASAGIEFAILGPREQCTGDGARRMGNEYLYQELAAQNVATLNGAGVQKIVASCPHCYNTLANEYPDFGGTWEVVHHTELLERLVAEGRITPKASASDGITYHDSCYLARHNDVRSEPWTLVESLGQPVREMERSGTKTFCCGAGGARMWMEEKVGEQINEERVRQAAETGADTLAVACPFCTIMLDDGVKSTGRDMQVREIATLLAEGLDDGAGG